MFIPSRACARPRQRQGTLLTRPAYGLTDQAPIQLTQMPCGCVTPPRIYASNWPTQNTWGAWASTTTAASMSTSGGPAPACVIGPKGPMIVEPEGRRARFTVGPGRPPDGGPEGPLRGVWLDDLTARATVWHSYTTCTQQQTGTMLSFCDMWPVTESHPAHPICLATSGYGKSRNAIEAPDDSLRIQSAVRFRRKICGGRPAGLVECKANGLA